MEYVWRCFDSEGVMKKTGNCKITIFIIYLASFLVLTFVVAVYSYAAESFTLEAGSHCFQPGIQSERNAERMGQGIMKSDFMWRRGFCTK
jgi:hypothetical protein